MNYRAALKAFVLAGAVFTSQAMSDVFYPITNAEVELPQGGNLWPVANLIQGPDVGFFEDEPYDLDLGGPEGLWVTAACGFPCDYVEAWGEPIVTLDLGQDRGLSEISVWGYSHTNANGVKDFSLRFATDTEGATGFGQSITYNPTFGELEPPSGFGDDPIVRESFKFSQNVSARYVEMTLFDNFFEPPGDGSGGEIPGGDRVGLGEVAFQAPDDFVPDPIDPGESIQFYPIADISGSTEDSDLWPVANLVQGPGTGFNDREPYQKTAGGPDGNWVTEACGFPCDYLDTFDPPEIIVDLGEDVELTQIDVWGYASSNANGIKEFTLEFATDAEGDDGFGSSIDYNPTFGDLENDDSTRVPLPFDQTVTARYVKFTATDNFFEEPGDGSNGETPGGDRIGFGEIAFPILGGGLLGDFDGDGELDVDDINLLTVESASGLHNADFDLTGDALVNQDDVTNWAKDLAVTWIGDANIDGEFTSNDFVIIFQGGKFETGEAATWEQGDWNGDGIFGSGDLVVAFQDGGFELGPRGGTQAVPEPSSMLMLLIGIGLMHSRRKR